MKKFIALMLAILLTVSFTACGKSEEAQLADDQIASIGEVTLAKKGLIEKAEKAVEELEEKDRKRLDNLELLQQIRTDFNNLLVADAEKAISAIGTVDTESLSKINTASAKYNALSAELRPMVSNYDLLLAAKEKYSDAVVEKVISEIDSIGEIGIETREKIEAAEKNYNSLSSEEKARVTNYEKLTEAKTSFDSFVETETEKALGKLKHTYDKVYDRGNYEPSSMPKYNNSRSYFLPLIQHSGGTYRLFAELNYYNNDWVFFDEIWIYIDGASYQWNVNYFDVERQVVSGGIIEYYFFEVTDGKLEVFEKIANSEEAIIRVKSDSIYDEFKVSAKDKQGIKDVLNAYKLMRFSGYNFK